MEEIINRVHEMGIVGYIEDYRKSRSAQQIIDQFYEDFIFKSEADGIGEVFRLYYQDISVNDKYDFHGFMAMFGKEDAFRHFLLIVKEAVNGKENDGRVFNEPRAYGRYLDFFKEMCRRNDVTNEEIDILKKFFA